MKLKMGMRVEMAKTAVSSMEASLPRGPIAPGQKLPLVVKFTQPDGKVLFSEGTGGGKVMWKDLRLTATIVNVDEKGNVRLSSDPKISDGKVGHITVTVPSHPDLHAELDIPFRYDIKYYEDYSGSRGATGFSGSDGSDGISGSAGSTDPNHPSAGGDGTNGGDGGRGKDGGRGGDAPNVDVLVSLDPNSLKPLLQVKVTAPGRETFYLVDPRGGSLLVRADGGAAGKGGSGGRAGRGGKGGIGSPNGQDGHDGLAGTRGFDGKEGEGGAVTVKYDGQARAYIGAIHVSAKNGPPTVFTEEVVAPLW